MFLEQFAHFSLQKGYMGETMLIHISYKKYLQSKHKLGTNVQNYIVTSNKKNIGGLK